MPRSSVAPVAGAPGGREPCGWRGQRQRHHLPGDERGGRLVGAAPRGAQDDLGGLLAGERHGRPAEGVDAPQLEAPLVDGEARHLDALREDRRGRERLLARLGPREGGAGLTGPSGVVREQGLVRRGGGQAADAADAHAVVALVVEPGAGEVGDDVGGEVGRGVVDLVEELVADRVEADPASRCLRLRDHRAAVGLDLRDRIGEVPRARDGPPVAAEVPARGLAGALEQVADEDARGEAVPVLERPAVLVHERPEEEGGVGDATGDDDVGALRERVGDRARAEVRGGEERWARELGERRSGLEVREWCLGRERRHARGEIVAEDGGDPDPADPELAGGLDRGPGRRRRVDAAGIGHDPRVSGGDRRERGGEVPGEVARVAAGLVALAVLLQDRERQLRERLEAEVVDAVGQQPFDRSGGVAVEPLTTRDADRHAATIRARTVTRAAAGGGRPTGGRPRAARRRAAARPRGTGRRRAARRWAARCRTSAAAPTWPAARSC